MNEALGAVDGERIANKWSAARIAETLLEAWDAEELTDVARELASGGAAESINGATVTSWLGYSQWAGLAHEIDHDPSNLVGEVSEILYTQAVETADSAPGIRLAMVAHTVGEKLARHVSEQAFVEAVEGVQMAEQGRETENVDVEAGDDDVQILTSKSDSPKTWKDKYSMYGVENAAEKMNFDYYVVLKMNDDDTLGVGVEEVSPDYEGTTAGTKAKNA